MRQLIEKKSGFCVRIVAIAACFLTAAALLFGFSSPVKAAQSGQPQITVEVVTADDSDQVRVSVEAVDSNSPAPSPAAAEVTGSGTVDFSLVFDRVGDYEYTVKQEGGSSALLNYDDSVYTVIVSVRNNSTYDGFDISQVVYQDPSQKANGIVFHNGESYYLVEHYLEQADGTYQLEKTEKFYAAADSEVTATPLSFEHYHENKEHTERIPSGIVLEVPMEESQEEVSEDVPEAEGSPVASASYGLTMLSTGTEVQGSAGSQVAAVGEAVAVSTGEAVQGSAGSQTAADGAAVAVSTGAVKVVSLSSVQQSSGLTSGPLVLKLYYAYDRYRVTYNDGVEESEIFPDQVQTEIPYGVDTPDYTGTLTREGYTFEGWDREIADTVTEDAVYMAIWKPVSTETLTETPTETPAETPADSGDGGSDSSGGTDSGASDSGSETSDTGTVEEATSESQAGTTVGSVQTGDSSQLFLWVVVFVLCGGGLIYAGYRQKK
ncbi:MAG: hypothetical protein LUH58_09615 [Lachnospiraceae bacterium]|nr:hypothetical protein [Lachnospiraceae bacterium]